jgi:hypothetical protein
MAPQNKVFFFKYNFTTPTTANIVHMLGVVGVSEVHMLAIIICISYSVLKVLHFLSLI